MTEKQNVSQVVNQKLCNSCGACFAVCKAKAIEFKETVGGYYFPSIDNKVCADCGLCLSVCPGINLAKGLMERMPDDPFAGEALKTFVGKATDKKIYENSQSGGIISALLVHFLEIGLADVAVTVHMNWGNPPRPRAILAKSINEIIMAQKSKYCPVPILSILRDVFISEQKIIFVGTPCQVHGLLNIMENIPKLRTQIVLIIGLICDRVMTYAALDFLIYRARLSNNNDKKLLQFRDKSCGGYPGNVHIQTINGKSIILPCKLRMMIKDLFTPARCRICFDKMNIFSDITVGDSWGISNVDSIKGESIAVIRTSKGLSVFLQALESNEILARELSYENILAGQNIEMKRKEWHGFVGAWMKLGYHLPDYYQRVQRETKNYEAGLYLDKIKYSLSLDEHPTREELFRFSNNQLFKQNLRRLYLWPFSYSKRFIYKAYNKILKR